MAKEPISGIMGEPKWTKAGVAALDQTARPGLGQKKSTTRVELPKALSSASPPNNPAVDVGSMLPPSVGGTRGTLHGAVLTSDGDLVK